MKTIELGHAVLYVRDLERSRHFYGEILGLPEIGPAFPGAAAFSGGRTHHELLLIEVGPAAASPPAGRRTGLYHLGFKIGTTDDELRDAWRELEAEGVTIVGASDHTVTHSLYAILTRSHSPRRRARTRLPKDRGPSSSTPRDVAA